MFEIALKEHENRGLTHVDLSILEHANDDMKCPRCGAGIGNIIPCKKCKRTMFKCKVCRYLAPRKRFLINE